MKGLLAKLFGVSGVTGRTVRGEGVAYKDFTIFPAVREEGGQWRIAGVIAKQTGEEMLEHEFVRADLLSSKDDAEAFAVRKGKQIIDERGERMFQSGGEPRHG